MRRAAKVDRNHSEIVTKLRQTFGPDCVLDLSRVGQGCPDILVGVRGKNILLEIKSDGGSLTNDQRFWHINWWGQAHVVYNFEEALQIIEKLTVDA